MCIPGQPVIDIVACPATLEAVKDRQDSVLGGVWYRNVKGIGRAAVGRGQADVVLSYVRGDEACRRVKAVFHTRA